MTAPNAMKQAGLLSVTEVARQLGLHRTTVWHKIRHGEIVATPVTERFVGISPKALDAYKAEFVGVYRSSRKGKRVANGRSVSSTKKSTSVRKPRRTKARQRSES